VWGGDEGKFVAPDIGTTRSTLVSVGKIDLGSTEQTDIASLARGCYHRTASGLVDSDVSSMLRYLQMWGLSYSLTLAQDERHAGCEDGRAVSVI